MDCTALSERLCAYLDGELAALESEEVGRHLQGCPDCAAAAQYEARLTEFLRQRLRQLEPAPAPLRERLASALSQAGTADVASASRAGWLRDLLASRWTPRLAMAAVVALLVAVPAWKLFHSPGQAPGVAVAAVERYTHHELQAEGPLPPCCADLAVRVGQRLEAPSRGFAVPDLTASGLTFVRAARCSLSDPAINLLAYQTADGSRFLLYITDGGAGQFHALDVRRTTGQARYRVPGRDEARARTYDVTLWERDGRLCTWVGPHASPAYDLALTRLQTR